MIRKTQIELGSLERNNLGSPNVLSKRNSHVCVSQMKIGEGSCLNRSKWV